MDRWTEMRVELLKARWAEGTSAASIAEELGPEFTRNSILGKAHRLGLPKHVTRIKKEPAPRQPVKPRRPPMIKPIPKLDQGPPSEDQSTWIPFMESTSKTCRAIMGRSEADGLALWCPTPKRPEESYCHYHQKLYYNRSSR